MYLLGKPIQQIDENDILRLIEEKVPESRYLDYKEEWLDMKELVPYLVAFVNTDGGTIVFGLETARDEKHNDMGIPIAVKGVNITNPGQHYQLGPIVKFSDSILSRMPINTTEIRMYAIVETAKSEQPQSLPYLRYLFEKLPPLGDFTNFAFEPTAGTKMGF